MSAVILASYQGLNVPFTDDGWFNATAAAARWGKVPNEWLRLPTTKRHLKAVVRKYGKFPYFRTVRGVGGGTWLHPKLGVRFAQWLDDDFAVWCDEQIEHLIHGRTLPSATVYMQRLAFEAQKAQSEQKGSMGSRLMSERRREKRALDKAEQAWKLRMEPGLFAALEISHA